MDDFAVAMLERLPNCYIRVVRVERTFRSAFGLCYRNSGFHPTALQWDESLIDESRLDADLKVRSTGLP